MKESFVLYIGMYEPIKSLSLEDKGVLLDALFEYNISGNEPINTSRIHPYFLFFKNQFRLDAAKYEKRVEANRKNGLLGGRERRSETNQNNPMGSVGANKADKDKDKDKENDKENVNVKDLRKLPMFSEIENEPFLKMCSLVSSQVGRLTNVSDYKQEYYQLIANNTQLQKQTGRSEEWLVNGAVKFIKDNAAVNQEWDNYSDFFKHFLNWTRKQPK